ncbi:MAG: hypothetical protein LBJ08_10725, partial [Bifidobacteriaceae bacterium]|nr:hypothetical protein [Bifidobacteriaceae bacterium]
ILVTTALSDARVLTALAARLGVPVDLSLSAIHAVLGEALTSKAPPDKQQPAPPAAAPPALHPKPAAGQALLATWHLHLDAGRLQAGEPHMAATAKAPYAVVSSSTAFEIDAAPGSQVRVSTGAGAITVPLRIEDIPDRVVWLPTNSPGCQVRATLGVSDGIVQIEAVAQAEEEAGR